MKESPSTHYPSSSTTTTCLPHPQQPSYSSPPDESNPGFPMSNQSDVYHSNSISPQFTSPPNPTVTLQHPPTLPTSFSPLDSNTSNSPQQTFNTTHQSHQHGSTSDSSPVGGGNIHSLQPLSPTRLNMNISSLKEPIPPPMSMHLPKYSDPSNFNQSQAFIPEYAAPPPTYEDSLQHSYIPPYAYSTNQIQGHSTVQQPPELSHFN